MEREITIALRFKLAIGDVSPGDVLDLVSVRGKGYLKKVSP